ncbi:MAG: PRC-barrel domain-containing protein [Jatrophihabitantaceae bacterium]
MLFSQASGRKVVSTSTAETVGQIADFVIDPQSHSLVALTVKKTGHGDTLLWTQITAFGADAVTVPGADAIIDANDAVAALAGKDRRLLGKQVLNTAGEDLGPVEDVDFDPATGRLVALSLVTGAIAGDRLIGIGSYAAVVHPVS